MKKNIEKKEAEQNQVFIKAVYKWDRFVPIIVTIISGVIVGLSGLLPLMFYKGFYGVYSIEHKYVGKDYLYNDAMMVSPLSFLLLILGVVFFLLISWDNLTKMVNTCIYIDRNYGGRKTRFFLYWETFIYIIKNEWWKLLTIIFIDYQVLLLLNNTIEIERLYYMTFFSAGFSYAIAVIICHFTVHFEEFTEGTERIISSRKYQKYTTFKRRWSKLSKTNKIYKVTGRDGRQAKEVIAALYQPKLINNPKSNNFSANESTMQLFMVIVTMFIMLVFSGFFILSSFFHGKRYAMTHSDYLVTEDGEHVVLPLSEDSCAVLDADINNASLVIYEKKIYYTDNKIAVEKQYFDKITIVDPKGEIISDYDINRNKDTYSLAKPFLNIF